MLEAEVKLQHTVIYSYRDIVQVTSTEDYINQHNKVLLAPIQYHKLVCQSVA